MDPQFLSGLPNYLGAFRKEPHSKLEEMAEEARKEGIPIMQPETMSTVEQFLRLYKPKKILEIGAAIGYSAINMALAAGQDAEVVTIEREPEMVKRAKANTEAIGLDDRITIIEKDALEPASDLALHGPFDVLFIDAGKGHYSAFFETYTPLLAKQGMVICDNVLFRGYVVDPALAPKRLQKLAEKMKTFNNWLHNHPDYSTVLLPIGDGLSVSLKNN